MPDTPTIVLRWPGTERDADQLVTREWLVTNGLGGYASGTVPGVVTRRYHGLLIAALPKPLGRTAMLNHLSEQLRLPDGTVLRIGGEQYIGRSPELYGAELLREFRLEMGLPVWRYDLNGFGIERRLVMPHRHNTVHVRYRLVEGRGQIRLKLRPAVHFRGHDAPVSTPLEQEYRIEICRHRYEVSGGAGFPPLRLRLHGDRPAFTAEDLRIREVLYRLEEVRGYDPSGDLWSPGYFRADLAPGRDVTLVASVEPWDAIEALSPEAALEAELTRRRELAAAVPGGAEPGLETQLVLAADQFLIEPMGRPAERARAEAVGEDVRTVIAGYHWFTDWGRDTMIGLEGLTIATGRFREAGDILTTFGQYVRDGLIPNLFPEGEDEGLYHTADATLWFFHAVGRFVRATGDRRILGRLLPVLLEIVARHVAGTRFGIAVDPADGLLRQGAEGYQLTWMDAKVDDWVVTPRRGKAVEINALWYNALRLLEAWTREAGDLEASSALGARAAGVYEAFNARFWNPSEGFLYDVVDGPDGDDPACRPNQIFSVSLTHPVLAPERWEAVLQVVEDRLLTPVGLRSLSPDHPDYKRQYYGDLRSRDAAYHQGTVWAWLIGPFVDAWLRTHAARPEEARAFLEPFGRHLEEACVGSISEIFDAEAPYTPRGCIAQAWSVAEVLRCWQATGARRP